MKRRYLRAFAAVCAASLLFASCGKKAEKKTEKKEETVVITECETAQSVHDNIIVGWNLGNTLDSTNRALEGNGYESFETAWGNPVTTKEMLTEIKNAGFNAVRIPVTWEFHFDENGDIDKEWMDRVQEVVDYAYSQDLYCILNVHHDGGENSWIVAETKKYEEKKDLFAHIWEQIADRFKYYDQKLLFEAVNEPLDSRGNWGSMSKDTTEAVNLFNQTFVDSVRKSGGFNETRNLVVMPYAGALNTGRARYFRMPEDTVENHLILEVHDYSPQGFCWKDASWTNLTSEWGSDADKAELDRVFADIKRHSEKLEVPVIIGEFGSQNKDGNSADRAAHAGYYVEKAKENGFKCFWWDCGDFALLDRYNVEISQPEIVSAIMDAAK